MIDPWPTHDFILCGVESVAIVNWCEYLYGGVSVLHRTRRSRLSLKILVGFISCCVNDFVTFGYFFLWLAVTLICYVAFKVWKCWSSYSMCLSDYGIPFSFIGIQAFSYVKHCWLWSVLPGNSQDRMPDFFIIVEIIVHAIEPMKPRNWLSRTRSSE